MQAEGVRKHPMFGRTTLKLTPRLKGKLNVARDRSSPVNIAYEVHGDGPRHLIVRDIILKSPVVDALTINFSHTYASLIVGVKFHTSSY